MKWPRDEYDCTRCHVVKRGRFTLPIDASRQGWDRGFQHLLWFCWDCLPYGHGRHDERRDAPKETCYVTD